MSSLNPASLWADIFCAASLEHRKKLASQFSVLRRIRPRVPFYKLPAHRLPTKWSLYRGLLRTLPSTDTIEGQSQNDKPNTNTWNSRVHGHAIRWNIRRAFREQRHLTSPKTCRERLLFWHKLLEYLQASAHDQKRREILRRYEGLLAFRHERFRMSRLESRELAWIHRMRNRAILTGGYHRPTVNNRPLPRLKPQPLPITMMIRNRIRARTRRGLRQWEMSQGIEDLRLEREFEQNVEKESKGLVDPNPEKELDFAMGEYEKPIMATLQEINKSYALDQERATTIYSPEMIARIKAARTAKIANKTRERQRELRGEVTKRSTKRLRQRPPPHILEKMTEKEKMQDRVMREVSLGGYSGRIKAQAKDKDRSMKTHREDDPALPSLGDPGIKVPPFNETE